MNAPGSSKQESLLGWLRERARFDSSGIYTAAANEIEHLTEERDFHQRTSIKLGDINVERAAEIERLRAEILDARRRGRTPEAFWLAPESRDG